MLLIPALVATALAQAPASVPDACFDFRLQAPQSSLRIGAAQRHKAWLRSGLGLNLLNVVPVPTGTKECDAVTWVELRVGNPGASLEGLDTVVGRWPVYGGKPQSGAGLSVVAALSRLQNEEFVRYEEDGSITSTTLHFQVSVTWGTDPAAAPRPVPVPAVVALNLEAPLVALSVVSQPARFLGIMFECRDLLDLSDGAREAITGDSACRDDPFKKVAISSLSTAPLGLRVRFVPSIRNSWAGISATVSTFALGASGLFGEQGDATGEESGSTVLVAPLDVFVGVDFQLPEPLRASFVVGGGAALVSVNDAFVVRPTFGLTVTSSISGQRTADRFGERASSQERGSRDDEIGQLSAAHTRHKVLTERLAQDLRKIDAAIASPDPAATSSALLALSPELKSLVEAADVLVADEPETEAALVRLEAIAGQEALAGTLRAALEVGTWRDTASTARAMEKGAEAALQSPTSIEAACGALGALKGLPTCEAIRTLTEQRRLWDEARSRRDVAQSRLSFLVENPTGEGPAREALLALKLAVEAAHRGQPAGDAALAALNTAGAQRDWTAAVTTSLQERLPPLEGIPDLIHLLDVWPERSAADRDAALEELRTAAKQAGFQLPSSSEPTP
jgi:hypothetical protein